MFSDNTSLALLPVRNVCAAFTVEPPADVDELGVLDSVDCNDGRLIKPAAAAAVSGAVIIPPLALAFSKYLETSMAYTCRCPAAGWGVVWGGVVRCGKVRGAYRAFGVMWERRRRARRGIRTPPTPNTQSLQQHNAIHKRSTHTHSLNQHTLSQSAHQVHYTTVCFRQTHTS